MSRTSQTTSSCDAVQVDLVEFADLALDEKRATQVELHLDSCPQCSRAVAELRRSLSLAQLEWDARASSARDSQTSCKQLRQRRYTRQFSLSNAGGLVGLAALFALLTIGWMVVGPNRSTNVIRKSMKVPLNVDERNIGQVVDIEAFLQHEEQAARLATTIDILANAPTAVEDVAKAKRYLEFHYGVTRTSGNEQPPTIPLQKGI